MQAQITFNLPEDKYEYDLANKAPDMHAALSDIDNLCRGKLKHCESYDWAELAEAVREIVTESGYHDLL